MSHFYGTLKGNKGEATRCGSAGSGVTTHAAGWGGAIRTRVFQRDGEDFFEVHLVPWASSGGTPVLLATGALDSQVYSRLVYPNPPMNNSNGE